MKASDSDVRCQSQIVPVLSRHSSCSRLFLFFIHSAIAFDRLGECFLLANQQVILYFKKHIFVPKLQCLHIRQRFV